MTRTVNLREAKTHFAELIERVRNGEVVIITRAGIPVAVLSPAARRVPGKDAGQVIMTPEFDEPLPEFEEA
jgi:prevent-host-death family protein